MELNKEQQIRAMATDIYSMFRSDSMSRALASMLYGEGYRKASEVAREIFEEMRSTAKAAIALLKYEKNTVIRMSKTECYQDLIGYIDMLEKKHTEEGK